jgi:hypothetical protein
LTAIPFHATSELLRDRTCRTLNQVRNLLRVRDVD